MTQRDPTGSVRLLVRLLRRDTAAVAHFLQERREALDELAAVALEDGLSVVLLRALADTALAQALPAQRCGDLIRRRERQAARYAVLAGGLARIAGALDDAGVPFMLLKGPYLAARFYGDPLGREFVDLDLLVQLAARRRALRVVEDAGFARRSHVLGSEALTAYFVHGFDLVSGGVNLDLHWSLSRHPSIRMEESRIWARRRSFELGGHAYSVLADEDEVTLEVLALLRDIGRSRPKIKNVVDLIQILASLDATMDWDALLARGRAEGTYGALVNVLALCLDLADAHDLAPRLAAALAQHAGRRVRPVSSATPFAFRPASNALPNLLWAARAHDTTLATFFAWWVVSLPFRRAVHGWPRPVAPPTAAAP